MTDQLLPDLGSFTSEEQFYNALVQFTQTPDLTEEERAQFVNRIAFTLINSQPSKELSDALYQLLISLATGDYEWVDSIKNLIVLEGDFAVLGLSVLCNLIAARPDSYENLYQSANNPESGDNRFVTYQLLVTEVAEYYSNPTFREVIFSALVNNSTEEQANDLAGYLDYYLYNVKDFSHYDICTGCTLMLLDLKATRAVEFVLSSFHSNISIHSLAASLSENRVDYYESFKPVFEYAIGVLAERSGLNEVLQGLNRSTYLEVTLELTKLADVSVVREAQGIILDTLETIADEEQSTWLARIDIQFVQRLALVLNRLADDPANAEVTHRVISAMEETSYTFADSDIDFRMTFAITASVWRDQGNQELADHVVRIINQFHDGDPFADEGAVINYIGENLF